MRFALLALSLPLCAHSASAVNILSNSTFTGTASVQATLGNDPAITTSDSWRLYSDGVVGLLAPTVTLGGTGSSISGFTVNALNLGLVRGEIAQVTTVAFVTGQQYRASIDITTPTILNVGLLSSTGSGVGMEITSGAIGSRTTEASTQSGSPLIGLTVLGANTVRLTLDYTADGTETGNIGLRLFAGEGTVLANLLTSATFDNASIEPVPEPNTVGLLVLSVGALAFMRQRQRMMA